MRYVVATLAGAASVCAFAPFSWYFIAYGTTALLFYLWLGGSPRQGAISGFLFGLGLFGGGVSWVYVSLHDFGGMPPLLAAFTVSLLVAVLAAFPAFAGWCQARWCPQGWWRAAVAIPALWLIAEWSRGWVLGGFPWLALGYTQMGHVLSGFAPAGGVYTVTAAVAVSAGVLAAFARQPGPTRLLAAVIVVGLLWAGGQQLEQWEWARPHGAPKSVSLVQGNVPLTVKWAPASRSRVRETYVDLSRDSQAELVVWPESAIPYYIDELSPAFLGWLREQPADFVFGVLERRRSGAVIEFYNSVLTVSDRNAVYRKVHLVPFGEYLPFASWLGWLLDYLHIPMADFSSWQEAQTPPTAAGLTLGITVCYEDAFAEEVRKALPAAQLLVNVSEDAWFGDSLAPHQRLQIARMRALESGRPMLRAANTGPSAIIDHRGRVVRQSDQFVTTRVDGVVQPMTGVTPYVRFGNVPVLVLALLGLIGARLIGTKRWASEEKQRR